MVSQGWKALSEGSERCLQQKSRADQRLEAFDGIKMNALKILEHCRVVRGKKSLVDRRVRAQKVRHLLIDQI